VLRTSPYTPPPEAKENRWEKNSRKQGWKLYRSVSGVSALTSLAPPETSEGGETPSESGRAREKNFYTVQGTGTKKKKERD